MNLIESILLHRYICSPTNWLHKLKSYYKTYFLFIYLCVIAYSHSKYMTIGICLYWILFLYIKQIHNNHTKILFHILYILFILIYITFLLIKLQFNTYIIKLSYIHYIIMYTYNKHILYFRIVLLIMNYFFTINILFMTTTYEDIIFSFLNLSKQYENSTIRKIIFISIFASQILENIGIKIKHILLSVRMKKITKLFRLKYYIYLILKFIQDVYNDIHRISTVLYTRELNHNLLYITNIHE
ncbi:hypothetical protein FGB62_c108 (chloroplast) [Gracilaria domingensis]|uniref:hypothetical protein n=1 Tax=Gracilaria domingensis TaxID=172961 RepID=UPI001D12140E|nr:hypothetical protein LK222_pgp117 [Gracilaria domingensis]KAI0556472.1 hypothetical protein FGB62_c108 [Gracilaria domingensis]UAD85379.1 hypothetical protein [Gracilaria domingensis]